MIISGHSLSSSAFSTMKNSCCIFSPVVIGEQHKTSHWGSK